LPPDEEPPPGENPPASCAPAPAENACEAPEAPAYCGAVRTENPAGACCPAELPFYCPADDLCYASAESAGEACDGACFACE
jgi:hypothetical protein